MARGSLRMPTSRGRYRTAEGTRSAPGRPETVAALPSRRGRAQGASFSAGRACRGLWSVVDHRATQRAVGRMLRQAKSWLGLRVYRLSVRLVPWPSFLVFLLLVALEA